MAIYKFDVGQLTDAIAITLIGGGIITLIAFYYPPAIQFLPAW